MSFFRKCSCLRRSGFLLSALVFSLLLAPKVYAKGSRRDLLRSAKRAKGNRRDLLRSAERSKVYANSESRGLFKSAEEARAAFNWNEALAKYRQIVEEYPDSPLAPKAHLQLGIALKDDQLFDDAIAHYEQAIAKAPGTRVAEDAKAAIAEAHFYDANLPAALAKFQELINETKNWRQVKHCSSWIKNVERFMNSDYYSMARCGPAALAKVCQLSDIEATTEELAKLIGLDERGASLEDLRKAAGIKGLKASGVQLSLKQLQTMKKPLIALLKPDHYVVVTGIDEKKGITIIDPIKSDNVRILSFEKFKEKWSHQALVFEDKQKLNPEIALLSKDVMTEARGKHCWCHDDACPPIYGGCEDNENIAFDGEPSCGPGMPRISVNTTTLSPVIKDTDLSYDGRGPKIEIKRIYNGDDPRSSVFGNSWTFNYNIWLEEDSVDNITLYRGSGKEEIFNYDFEDDNYRYYESPIGVYDTLTKNLNDGTWSLEIKDGKTTQNFDTTGRLASIVDRYNKAVTFQYNDSAKNPVLTFGYSTVLDCPIGVAVDSSGYVYAADSYNNRIVKFTDSGVFSSIIKGLVPYGVAIDSSGYVYVADTYNHRIVKYTDSGVFSSKIGVGQLSYPYGVAVDSAGYIYVADTGNNRIVMFEDDSIYTIIGVGELSAPDAVAIDSAGNVYVADAGNDRIAKFNNEYSLTGTIGVGQLSYPYGVAVDSAGYVYAVDTGNNRIVMFEDDNIYAIIGSGQLSEPDEISIDSAGYIYVADTYNHRVVKFDSSGTFQSVIGSGQLNRPGGVAVDSAGCIYVADAGNNRIAKFEDNTISTVIGGWKLILPTDAAIDSTGNIYVVDWGNDRIVKFTDSGVFSSIIGSGELNYPGGVAVDSAGYIYVADTYNYRVVKFDSEGSIITSWGTYGYGNEQFNAPIKIAVDSSGYVYVADKNNSRISKFTDSGVFSSIIGVGQLYWPSGVAVDSSGNIYVGDSSNNRIVKFDSEGSFVTFWGTSGPGHGQFDWPAGVTLDSSGNIYVADSGNNRIVKFDPELPFANGTLMSITDATDRVTRLTYEDGRIVSVIDPAGRMATYSYDTNGNLASTTDMAENTVDYFYDENCYITTVTTPKGDSVFKIKQKYPGGYYLTGLTNPDGIPKNYCKHAWEDCGTSSYISNDEIIITDGNGQETIYRSTITSPIGNTKSVTDALGNQMLFSYDSNGNRNHITDPNGHTYLLDYDDNGNITTMTSPMGRSINAEYDSNDNLTTLTDPQGHTINFHYDENSNITSIISGTSTLFEFTYNNYGELTSMTDAMDNTTIFSYDSPHGNLTGIAARGETSYIFSHDMVGRVTKVTDRDGNSTSYQYDGIDRITKVTNALGDSKLYSYECCGLYSFTDEEGKTTNFSYKSTNGLTNKVLAEVVDSLLGTTEYEYDDAFNLTSVTNALNNSVTYSYDAIDRLEKDADQTVYSYDKAGNILARTDANLYTVRYTYDDDNWLTTISYPDSSSVNFTYNDNGNLTGMTDANGESSFIYTFIAADNRLVSATDCYSNTIQYAYNEVGNLSSLTYPDSKIVTYGYDELHRLARVTDWLNNVTEYDYLFDSYIHTITYPNGVTTVYGYDDNRRLTSMVTKKSNDDVIASYNYTLDKVGNRIQVDKTEPLTGELDAGSTTYTYNTDNQLVSGNAGSMLYSYDDNGNLVEKTIISTTTNYSYDYENRLVLVDNGTTSTRYTYDGLGNRIAKTVNGTTTTRYVVNMNSALSQVIAETDTNGTITVYYIYGLGLLAKITPEGDDYYYHYDGLGNTIAMTDSAENIKNKYAYDSYGKIPESTDVVSNPFKYVGMFGVMDEGNDLYYMRARYYDAAMRRFINKDPYKGSKRQPLSLNRYAYVEGNPVNRIDPSGLFLFSSGDPLIDFIQNMHLLSMYLCSKGVADPEDARFINMDPQPDDRWQHCVTGYKISKKCGYLAAYIAAIFKELRDALDGDPGTNYEPKKDIPPTWDGAAAAFVGGSCGDGSSGCDPDSLCEDMGYKK